MRGALLLLLLTLGCAHAASDQRALARFQERALEQHDRVFFLTAREPTELGLDPDGAQRLRDLKARDRALRDEIREMAGAVKAGDLAGPALRAVLLPLQAGIADVERRADDLYAVALPNLTSSAHVTLAARADLPPYLELTRLVVRVDGHELARIHALGHELRGLYRGALPPGPHVARVYAWFRGRGAAETGKAMGEFTFTVARALAFRAQDTEPRVLTIQLTAESRPGIDHRLPTIHLEQAR